MDKRFPIEDQIDMLASALKGRVINPHHPDYDSVRLIASGQFDHRPAAVIRPASAADVAAVVNFANATGLALAVRSGGHSVPGYSGVEGGLVIDLRDLNGMTIDPVGRTGWFGTGLTAGEVTAALEPQKLIIGFGDSASVGIGGLTLGGGIGYLVRKHGLTVDQLMAAEVVTANGDIVIADATNHPDLFWALRGGGGNFGVVTRMRFRLQRLEQFIGGPLILPATPEVIAGFAAAAEAAPDELTAIALVLPAPPLPFLPPQIVGQTVLMAMMAYAGDAEAAARALAPFRALTTPIADLVGPAPLSSLYIPEDPNMRPAVACRSLFMERIGRDEAAVMLDHLDRDDAPMRAIQIRVLGGAAARVAGDATAFAHRQSRIMIAALAMDAPPAAARHDAWARDAVAALRQGDSAVYVNFLADEPERLRHAYPGATWERLRRVKRQYDPENLFRRNQNIPPA
ncbi:MAG TPA: FAD-binding oxidoreductase [Devosia sp.]|mgnify:CR=1 FL=1|nr:FAD-binding oxidoreductase [Devosia sp.]